VRQYPAMDVGKPRVKDVLALSAREVADVASRLASDCAEAIADEEQGACLLLEEAHELNNLADLTLVAAVQHARDCGVGWRSIGSTIQVTGPTARERYQTAWRRLRASRWYRVLAERPDT
jgi:hypothetical protein